ncbi:MAG: hypothetical protein CMI66_05080 [Pedosphaera sp.]|nr:hypothetical protein [Pedosphaera sp.]
MKGKRTLSFLFSLAMLFAINAILKWPSMYRMKKITYPGRKNANLLFASFLGASTIGFLPQEFPLPLLRSGGINR